MKKLPDIYALFGVPRDADADTIKQAWRREMKKNHPDVNSDKEQATKICQAINAAYDVLSDPKRRAAYDVALRNQEYVAAAQRQAAASTQSAPDRVYIFRNVHLPVYVWGQGQPNNIGTGNRTTVTFDGHIFFNK